MAKNWERLLGGYATDTLTDQEKYELFQSALQDQELFDALADEESLKALLADPEARERILVSLRTTSNTQDSVASSEPAEPRWFRQPSSLAWMGSMAALGLALIFGWQMERDWGPMVQEEHQSQEREPSQDNKQEILSSSKQDEIAFRAIPFEMDDQISDFEENEEVMPSENKPESVAVLPPKPKISTENVSQTIQRPSMVVEEDKHVSEDQGDSAGPPLSEQVSEAPDVLTPTIKQQNESEVQAVREADFTEMARPEDRALSSALPKAIVNPSTEESSSLELGALDLFYSKLQFGDEADQSARADVDASPPQKSQAVSPETEPKEEGRATSQEKLVVKKIDIRQARGLRYSFVRETDQGEVEVAESQHITESWRDVRLAIEPNEEGYLYVLAPIGMGKWQVLQQVTDSDRKQDVENSTIKPFETVQFRLGVFTNVLGKLVISSLTVVFSHMPVENLGQLVERISNTQDLTIEQTEDSVYAVQSERGSNAPLLLIVPLGESGTARSYGSGDSQESLGQFFDSAMGGVGFPR